MGLFDVAAVKMDGVDVIKVFFAGGSEKPYYLKKFGMTPKGCYIRVGSFLLIGWRSRRMDACQKVFQGMISFRESQSRETRS
jgi:hypothetical protein